MRGSRQLLFTVDQGGPRGARVNPISGTMKTGAFSKNARSRFASVVLDSVLGHPRLARHTWWCPCISVVPEATDKVSQGPYWSAPCQLFKTPFKGLRRRRVSCWEEQKRIVSGGGHWFAFHQANQWYFTCLAPKYLTACTPLAVDKPRTSLKTWLPYYRQGDIINKKTRRNSYHRWSCPSVVLGIGNFLQLTNVASFINGKKCCKM